MVYKGKVLPHVGTTILYDDGASVTGRFSTFSGSFSETETGLRIKYSEANSNLYFTTSSGIKRISASQSSDFTTATGYIEDAGIVKGLDLSAVVDYNTPSFFSVRSKIGYRILFGKVDTNNNTVLGAPSQFLEVTNFSYDDTAAVTLSITVPQEVDSSDYFYRVYRTAIYSETLGLDLVDVATEDELNLIEEASVPATSLISKTIVISDITPDSIRRQGLPLYTNVRSGEGIAQANDRPPVAKDIGLFNGHMFYANTRTKYQKEIDLLSVDDFVSDSSKFIISNGSTTREYTFRGVQEVFTVDLTPSTGLSLPTGLDSQYLTFAAANDERKYYAYFASSEAASAPTGLDGRLPIRVDTSTYNIRTFSVTGAYTYASGDWTTGYFTLDAANNDPEYYVWYRTDASQSPTTVPGREGIEVNIIGYTTLGATLQTTKTTIDSSAASAYFTTELDTLGSTLTITNKQKGSVQTAIENFAPANFTIADVYSVTVTGNIIPAITGAISASAGADFSTIVSGNVITVTNLEAGSSEDASGFFASGFTVSVVTQGQGEDSATNKVLLSKNESLSVALRNTAQSLIRVSNKDASGITIGSYISGPTDVAGQMLFEAETLGDNQFYFAVSSSSMTTEFSPDLPYTRTITAITNVTGSTVRITSSGHGFSSSENVIVYNSNSTPPVDGIFTITAASSNTFDINISSISSTGLSASGSSGSVFLASISADNQVSPNRIFWSKFQEPEAVPLLNYQDVGPRDKAIKRILPLRDSLFILKEDGVYRLYGSNGDFSIVLFDNSAQILAPDSAAVLNNLIYMLSTQGVVSVSETGVQIISRDIEDKVKAITCLSNYPTRTFGVGYETDRAYLLSTVKTASDTVPTQMFRYNIFTRAWTQWDKSYNCGIVNPQGDKLYFGAADTGIVEVERKNCDRTDYADRQFDRLVSVDGVDGKAIDVDIANDITIGDALVQTQYLTIAQYNRMLKKLDVDNQIATTSFFTDLAAVAGNDMDDKVTDLATKLDTVPSLTGTNFVSGLISPTSFADTQTNFNFIANTLNASSGAFFSNYSLSSGTTIFETVVVAVDPVLDAVTGRVEIPFIANEIVHYKAYKKDVQWAPYSEGDVSLLKQAREGTLIFLSDDFSIAKMGYSSDLSPDFEFVQFERLGDGSWGKFVWGAHTWGGEGTSVPLRTFIPRGKQRCRYVNVRFTHEVARETFQLYGMSLEMRAYSTKGYRA
jgi:hypothetical protein